MILSKIVQLIVYLDFKPGVPVKLQCNLKLTCLVREQSFLCYQFKFKVQIGPLFEISSFGHLVNFRKETPFLKTY